MVVFTLECAIRKQKEPITQNKAFLDSNGAILLNFKAAFQLQNVEDASKAGAALIII